MSDLLRTPVVLILYNRSETTTQVVDVLRQVRPATLYVAADGPRPGDEARCAAARTVVDAVDWPGTVHRWYSTRNRGNRLQIPGTLDEVFSRVDRAIVVEDDVVAHPRFFPWCEAMLDRYAGDRDVQQVSGRNDLGRWDAGGRDHLLAYRGSIWGWGTWATAWTAARRTAPRGAPPAALDPLVADHLRQLQAMLDRGHRIAWDNEWTLKRILHGGLSVVPPVNLVRNVGFGAEASHTVLATDPRGALDVVEPAAEMDAGAPAGQGRGGTRPAVDARYDRWSLLFELMCSYTDPAAARRLSRASRVLERAAGAEHDQVVHHLAPFRDPEESSAALEHLRPHLGGSPSFDRLSEVMAEAAGRPV